MKLEIIGKRVPLKTFDDLAVLEGFEYEGILHIKAEECIALDLATGVVVDFNPCEPVEPCKMELIIENPRKENQWKTNQEITKTKWQK